MTALALQLRTVGGQVWSADRAWLASALLLAALAVLAPTQALESLGFVGRALWSTAPFLLASVAIAAYAGASGADGLIARAFSGRTAIMVVTAALFGGLSPFCSCGVIPLIAALLAMGVPLAPVMAFWLASPVIDPSMFVLTAGLLSVDFAIAKTLAAVGLGLLGGFGTMALAGLGGLKNPLKPDVGNGGCGGASVRNPEPPVWAFWQETERRERFRRDALKTTLFLGKWLTLAFLLESLMVAYIPAETISGVLGGEGLAPVLTATLIGVPAYLNGYAATPLVAGLIGQGMAAGAGMAFLVAGGVTSMPAAIAVFALVRTPVFLLYVAFALAGSLAAGLLYQGWAGL